MYNCSLYSKSYVNQVDFILMSSKARHFLKIRPILFAIFFAFETAVDDSVNSVVVAIDFLCKFVDSKIFSH